MRNWRQWENRERSGGQEVERSQLERQKAEKPGRFPGRGPTRLRCKRQQPCEHYAASTRRRNYRNSSGNGHLPGEFVLNLQHIGPSRTATVQLIIPNALFQENDVSTNEPRKPEQQHNVECGAKRCRSDTEKQRGLDAFP